MENQAKLIYRWMFPRRSKQEMKNGNSPQYLNYPKTKLNIEKGEMVNYTPLSEQREIHISFEDSKIKAVDLRQFLEQKKR